MEAALHIADLAFVEPVERQAQEVMEDLGLHVERERRRHELQGEAPKRRRCDAEQRHHRKACGDGGQEPGIALQDRLIDHELHVERAGEHADLDDERQHDRLDEPAHGLGGQFGKRRELEEVLLALLLEAGGRRHLERDPSEIPGGLLRLHEPGAERRVVDLDAASGDALEYHEVRHAPVQDGGRPQVFEFLDLAAQRTAAEPHAACGVDQALERRALERDRELATERGKVRLVAVEARDHRKASQPALRAFGLPDERQRPKAREAQEGGHQRSPLTVGPGWRGSVRTTTRRSCGVRG